MLDRTITIDRERCDGEGLCVSLCPMRIFSFEDQRVPEVSGEEHCVPSGKHAGTQGPATGVRRGRG
jgi:ferredoxin